MPCKSKGKKTARKKCGSAKKTTKKKASKKKKQMNRFKSTIPLYYNIKQKT